MERSQVTNGCSGGCCEKFTLPVTMNDLHAMKAEYNKITEQFGTLSDIGPAGITAEDGRLIRCCPEEELDKLIAMLIPLGTTEIDPQVGENLAISYEYDPEKHSPELVRDHTRGHLQVVDGKVVTKIFTCRHFDTVNKVCTNYENRPVLCQDFGKKCKYAGCGYAEKIIKNISNKEAIAQ